MQHAPTRFLKEQALRALGVALAPYPTMHSVGAASMTPQEADRTLLKAGTTWEAEIDRLYLQLVLAMPQASVDLDVQPFVETCRLGGLAAALGELNSRVAHRYSAVYRLCDGVLRNIALADKAGEVRPEYLAEVPIGTSFCQFVLRDGVFLTEHSGQDARLNGHPYQGVMVAYHGVPISAPDGSLIGTLCHFDVQEQRLSETEFAYLRAVAAALPAVLV